MDLPITATLTLPSADLSWSAAKAGGPGGQHVNKTNSKVDLRFDLEGTTALIPPVKARLRAMANLDADGRVIIVAASSRSQQMNLEEARKRLAELVRKALVRPKRRRATKPSRGAKRRRLEDKRRTATKKQSRGKVGREDY